MKLGITDNVDCAHFLPGHPKCGRLHGHTYKVEVVIEAPAPAGGMIVDFAELKAKTRQVLEQYDHRNWNDTLEYPSVENICSLLCTGLRAKIEFPFVLRVYEGALKWAEMDSREEARDRA